MKRMSTYVILNETKCSEESPDGRQNKLLSYPQGILRYAQNDKLLLTARPDGLQRMIRGDAYSVFFLRSIIGFRDLSARILNEGTSPSSTRFRIANCFPT